MKKFNTEENEFDTTDMIDVKLHIGEINSNLINVTDVVANDISVNETIVSRINITNYAYYGDFEIDNAFLGWDNEKTEFVMGKFENPKDTYDVSNMLDVKLRCSKKLNDGVELEMPEAEELLENCIKRLESMGLENTALKK